MSCNSTKFKPINGKENKYTLLRQFFTTFQYTHLTKILYLTMNGKYWKKQIPTESVEIQETSRYQYKTTKLLVQWDFKTNKI